MKLEQIHTFILVADYKSFIKAANKLKISNAAVSRQIQQLEKLLAIKLFERTTRHIELTQVGQHYYESCKRALAELDRAENVVRLAQKEATGKLKVVVPHYFANIFILPKLKNFLLQYPAIQLELETAERTPDLLDENIDILFGVSVAMPEDTVRKRIAKTRYVLCASPDYLQKWGDPQKIADLKQHRYITHTMRHDPKRINFKNNTFLTVEPYLYLNSAVMMKECALMGLGIIWVHEYQINDALQQKKLIEILPQYAQAETGIYLYYRRNPYLPLKIRAFVDFFS